MPNKKRKRDKVNTDNSKDTTVANQKRRIQKEIRVHEEIIKILRKCKDTRKIDLKIIEGAVRGSMHDQHDLAVYYFGLLGTILYLSSQNTHVAPAPKRYMFRTFLKTFPGSPKLNPVSPRIYCLGCPDKMLIF